MQLRTLSSLMTFYLKFICSGFFIVFILFFFAILWHPHLKGAERILAWIFFLIWLGLTILFVGRWARWKRVRMDIASLHISNYFREIQVPLTSIAAVTEHRGFGPHTVTIQFRERTAFGEAIRFKPRLFMMFWREHPVVSELRLAAGGVLLTPAQLAASMVADRKRIWIAVGLILTFVVGLVSFLQAIFRHSDPYRLGLQALMQDVAVTQALGTPMKPGLFIGGQITKSDRSGCAVLDFPLQGSQAEGEAHVNAYRTEGEWHLSHVWLDQPGSAPKVEVLNVDPKQAGAQCSAPGQASNQ